ncbi:hypothetical protein PQ712_06775 [Staphylococcus ureilyticus]|uniref:hypothetical protein n=1 Tax=Staphylococcus ureilyticus TaxID=94138 RepID=UPI002928ADEB|nr:hypothetical protein [Staphylococcus ureilyticus]MDU9371581.1 hypothetical protein [Staphylococcus ureilyticus]
MKKFIIIVIASVYTISVIALIIVLRQNNDSEIPNYVENTIYSINDELKINNQGYTVTNYYLKKKHVFIDLIIANYGAQDIDIQYEQFVLKTPDKEILADRQTSKRESDDSGYNFLNSTKSIGSNNIRKVTLAFYMPKPPESMSNISLKVKGAINKNDTDDILLEH